MNGVARSFNALAAQSNAFSDEKRIKRAIFSGITLDQKSGNVSFSLKAELDPALIVNNANPVAGTVLVPQTQPQIPLATSTTP